MIALLAALCLMGAPGVQGKSLLEQVVPQPTGRNGYEEYLRAAQIVAEGDASVYFGWQPGLSRSAYSEPEEGDADGMRRHALAKRLDSMTLLEVRREALAKYGQALVLVNQGNAKPVFDPRPNMDMSTLFPELAQFRNLAKFALAAAYVYDADGHSSKATDTLLDSLVMSRNISSPTLISYLVGIACQSIVLASFQTRMDRLSATDADRVIRTLSEGLARPPAVADAIRGEARFMLGATDELLRTPTDSLEGLGVEGDGFAKLTPSQREEVVRGLRAKLQVHYDETLLRFQGQESEWVFEDPEAVALGPDPTSPSEIAEALFQQLVPVFSQMGLSAARERTQQRLLRLAARIIAFRWEHERLPSTLEDAAPADEIADPLTGGRFEYTPLSDRFRVYSKGVPATGEIDIRYVRNRRDSEPPPPVGPFGSARIHPRFGSAGDSSPKPMCGMNPLRRESAEESAHSHGWTLR